MSDSNVGIVKRSSLAHGPEFVHRGKTSSRSRAVNS